MRKKLIITVGILLVFSVTSFVSCARGEEAEEMKTAEVIRGDLLVTVNADGNLDMPHEAKLKFGSPGTVKGIYVNEGDRVREGTLLAKLDDTIQKLAVAQAQYNIELAMNEMMEKIHPAVMGYPKLYPDPNASQIMGQAIEEVERAKKFVGEGKYQDAVSELRLAQHDLEACYYLINLPEIKALSVEYDDFFGIPGDKYPQITEALTILEHNMTMVINVQALMGNGSYDLAATEMAILLDKMEITDSLVKSVSGRIRMSQRLGACCQQAATQTGGTGLAPTLYPDTSTSLDFLHRADEGLQDIQALMTEEDYDAQEIATLLRLAQHDVDLSRTILEENELIYRSGMNLKASRGLSLKLQLGEIALKNAKDALMKTEILSPFDGIVVFVGVKEDDQLSSFDYSSRVAVHVVDTKMVEMRGTVDEIDIYRVKEGQDVIISVDALPDEELMGKVTFISPFGTQQTGILNFAVTIELEPSEAELKGGLTATGDIIVDQIENALLIPNRAIKGTPGDQWVEVLVDEAKKVTEKRSVELGLQNEINSEVISGLTEGDKVVISGGVLDN
jgi:RND family efflux transporter MFP subunit